MNTADTCRIATSSNFFFMTSCGFYGYGFFWLEKLRGAMG